MGIFRVPNGGHPRSAATCVRNLGAKDHCRGAASEKSKHDDGSSGYKCHRSRCSLSYLHCSHLRNSPSWAPERHLRAIPKAIDYQGRSIPKVGRAGSLPLTPTTMTQTYREGIWFPGISHEISSKSREPNPGVRESKGYRMRNGKPGPHTTRKELRRRNEALSKDLSKDLCR